MATSTRTSRAQNPRQPTLCIEQFFCTAALIPAAASAFSKVDITSTPPAAIPPVPMQTLIDMSFFMKTPAPSYNEGKMDISKKVRERLPERSEGSGNDHEKR